MSFLGKIGQSLGIGDLTHQPIKSLIRTGAEVGGAVLGGPLGAAAGGALGTAAVGDQTGSHSVRADLTEGLRAYGIGSAGGYLYDNAGNLISSAGDSLSSGLDSAKTALGFPSSTVAPTATAAGSASQIALDPNLISDAAGGVAGSPGATGAAGADGFGGGGILSNTALNSPTFGTGASAGGALPASTVASTTPAAAPGILDKVQSALNTPLGKVGTTLAPVALQAAKGNTISPAQKALEAQANQLGSQGAELTEALKTGKLPAGQQATFDQAKQDAISAIKADYANRGLSGSTMEQQALQAAETSAASAQATQLQSLFQTGLSEIGSSSQIYDKIMSANIEQNKDLSTAISAAIGSMGNYRSGAQTNAA